MQCFHSAAGRMIAVVILASCCGCKDVDATQVSGKVLLDGAALSGANLQLIGEDPGLGMHSTGSNERGEFLFDESGGSTTPIQPGKYVLLISKRALPPDAASLPGGGMGADVETVPAAYQDRQQSPVKVHVTAAKTELPTVEITSKSP